jgi:membrane protease YdiL (CAAX protease family)
MEPGQNPTPTRRPSIGLGAAAAMYSAMTLVAVGGAWWLLGHTALALPDHEGVPLIWKLGLGAGGGLAVFALDQLGERLVPALQRMSQAFAQLLGRGTQSRALGLALLSSVGEEVFFRGFLLPWLGLVVSSILFGLLHIAPDRRLWLWPLMATAMGFGFGWLYQFTGDVLAPTLAHFTINFFALSVLARRDVSGGRGQQGADPEAKGEDDPDGV